MDRIAIVCKPLKEKLGQLLPELIGWIRKRGYEPLLDEEAGKYCLLAAVVPRAEMPACAPALVIVLGGDGTLLSVARIFEDLYATLDGWCKDCYQVDERAMLHADLWRDGAVYCGHEALNDIVVSKGDIARMGEFAVELNGKKVAGFRADGVIVSTPTGSTAYTLAANGPILTPDVDAMVVTPICPHLLTLRPIVVRGDASLTVRIVGIPNTALLTVDGQQGVELLLGDEVRCHRSTYTVKLVRLSEGSFFEVLRNKLSWGER
jgi:NAD+ kinase